MAWPGCRTGDPGHAARHDHLTSRQATPLAPPARRQWIARACAPTLTEPRDGAASVRRLPSLRPRRLSDRPTQCLALRPQAGRKGEAHAEGCGDHRPEVHAVAARRGAAPLASGVACVRRCSACRARFAARSACRCTPSCTATPRRCSRTWSTSADSASLRATIMTLSAAPTPSTTTSCRRHRTAPHRSELCSAPATSAPGLGPPLPTSARGLGPPLPHLHND
jgi:hypothetical protein